MPIVTTLDMVMLRRKMTLTELSAKVKITLANLSNLKRGKARAIRFSTLELLCDALHCQPADLIEYKPEIYTGIDLEINLIRILKEKSVQN